MTAVDVLHNECEKRGWRIGLECRYPAGRNNSGAIVTRLVVRRWRADRELLAAAASGPAMPDLERAAVDCATALRDQGLLV